MSDKKPVLILCTGNSARSQMAEGLLRHDAGQRFEAESAGTKASFVRPEAITVMQEVALILPGIALRTSMNLQNKGSIT